MTAICYNKKQEERLFLARRRLYTLAEIGFHFQPIVAIQITYNSSFIILKVFVNTKINRFLWTYTIF